MIEQKFEKTRTVEKDGLEFIEFQRISEWHPKHSPQCRVCNHPLVGEIENMYMSWATLQSLQKKYELQSDVRSVRNHFRVTGLEDKRFGDRRKIHQKLIEKGMAADHTPSVTEIQKSLDQLDRLDGKIVERTESTVKTREERDAEFAEILKLIPKSMRGEK